MRAVPFVLFIAWLSVCPDAPVWARQAQTKKAGRPYRLAWEDLPLLIAGARIALETSDGARLRGAVLSVEPDTLTLNVTKTSNQSLYGKGRLSLPRSSVREIEVTKRRGAAGRALGTTLGHIYGTYPGLGIAFGAILEGAYWGPVIAGIITLPPTLGYFLGRVVDWQEMVITLEDPPSGATPRAPR